MLISNLAVQPRLRAFKGHSHSRLLTSNLGATAPTGTGLRSQVPSNRSRTVQNVVLSVQNVALKTQHVIATTTHPRRRSSPPEYKLQTRDSMHNREPQAQHPSERPQVQCQGPSKGCVQCLLTTAGPLPAPPLSSRATTAASWR